MGFTLGLVYFVIAAISLLLIGLVLIQDSKAGGLSAAIAGGGDSFVGASANAGITKITAYLATVFILLCLVAGVLNQKDKNSSLGTEDPGAQQIGAGDPGSTPGEGGATPPTGAGVTPPTGDGVTPPTGDGVTPPTGDGAKPPAGDGTTGGTGTGGTTPPTTDGTTTPPTGTGSTGGTDGSGG